MKRMNNLKNVIAAKIMGGMVIGMTAVAGVAPVTVFAQSQEASSSLRLQQSPAIISISSLTVMTREQRPCIS